MPDTRLTAGQLTDREKEAILGLRRGGVDLHLIAKAWNIPALSISAMIANRTRHLRSKDKKKGKG